MHGIFISALGILVAIYVANQNSESFKEGTVMTCGRCGGMMIYETFYFPEDTFPGWRCIFCGEIIDPLILENRLGHSQQI
jgi:hypothetical protein